MYRHVSMHTLAYCPITIPTGFAEIYPFLLLPHGKTVWFRLLPTVLWSVRNNSLAEMSSSWICHSVTLTPFS